MRLLLACAIIGLCGMELRADDKVEWKEFTCKEGGYKALLPGKPDENSFDQESPLGKVVVHMAGVETEARVYGVSYTDFPEKVKEVPVKEALDDARDGASKTLEGKLLAEKEIKIGNYPGRDLKIADKDGQHFYRARIYLVGPRLYQVVAYGSADEIASKAADAFFASFKLLEK